MRYTNETIDAQTLTGGLQRQEYTDCTFTHCRWQDLRGGKLQLCQLPVCGVSVVQCGFQLYPDAGWPVWKTVPSGVLPGAVCRAKARWPKPLAAVKNCMFQYNDFSGMALPEFDFASCEFRDCRF